MPGGGIQPSPRSGSRSAPCPVCPRVSPSASAPTPSPSPRAATHAPGSRRSPAPTSASRRPTPACSSRCSATTLLEGSGSELRRTTLPLFLAFVGLVAEVHPWCDDPTAATAALWANLHGLAQLRASGSLRLATGSDGLDSLLRTSLDAHLGPAAR
ncbi:TetR-like C-terminal domain-containing protein [Kitasatospora aureofaciens]|uniref:TetR-like C-terminal domain-containing protein n=1 Tax=Kitasatospora aureofaciens TaxID=1894 RepID=UPI000691C1F8|nr:TetR-like C-terminal domain-containing protein [Kitasatospora aureofaciens]HJD82355.1 WHG domain-containing protein [Kitasatospora aureofaciens]